MDGADDGNVPGAVEGTAGELGEVARGATERLMFFSDAVVAIAITLLAIELPVPDGRTTRELLASLAANSLAYLTFVISFMVIGAHWRAHHRVFRYLGRVDRTFVQLNFAWLLIIVATPFLTEIIREGELDVARFGLYALAQALLLIVFGLMQTVAGRRGLFVSGTPPEITSRLSSALQTITARDDFRRKVKEFLQIPQGGTPEQFASFLAQDSDNWGRIVTKAGIRIE